MANQWMILAHLMTSDDESDYLMTQALDEHESMLQFSSDDEDALAQVMDQMGGALPGGPLFQFTSTPIGQRRRWRNVVRGMTYRATLEQLRDVTDADNVGEALTEALSAAIDRELRAEGVRDHDRVNFSITAHGFTQAFQSVNFQVREFLERTLRVGTQPTYRCEFCNFLFFLGSVCLKKWDNLRKQEMRQFKNTRNRRKEAIYKH